MPKSDNLVSRPILLASKRVVQRFPALLGQLTLGFTEQSIPTTLVCPSDLNLDSLLRGAVEVIRYPSCDLPLAERIERGRLLKQLAGFNATVLHCLCESKAAQARLRARSLDIPYVLNVNSLQLDTRAISLSSTRCVRIICPTQTVAEHVGLTHPTFADRITRIGPGVFVEDMCCAFSDPQQQATLVMTHPFDQAAAFAPVLDAMRGLLSLGYAFCVVMMGQGPAEHALRQLIKERDLGDVVTIVPELDPWRAVLTAGDIFIQPQPIPGLNFFLMEAMSVGTAVAACRGGVDDMIIDGQTALVFDPTDHRSIQAVLQTLLDQQDRARALAQGGQAYLRAFHSTSEMIEGVLQTYRIARQWSYGLATLR